MSACSDSQSTILPLPSSPHCEPTTTTFAIPRTSHGAAARTLHKPGARPKRGPIRDKGRRRKRQEKALFFGGGHVSKSFNSRRFSKGRGGRPEKLLRPLARARA